MATPTLTPEEYNKIKNANKKTPDKVIERVQYVTKEISKKASGFLEGFTFLIMVILYFFFTGLAITFGRRLPKFWEEIGKSLEGGRISQKINEKAKENEIKQKAGKIKIVDLETGQSI